MGLIYYILPPGRFAGSIFVNRLARLLLQSASVLIRTVNKLIADSGKLEGSTYDNQLTMDYIVQEFDRTTKRLFADASKVQWVTVGGPAERNPALGIRNGKLRLEGYVRIHSRSGAPCSCSVL